MTTESVQDVFERRYMGKFDSLAAEYGIVVKYERDRAARDIGIHLMRKRKSGSQTATGSLIWFQMKGLMKDTFSKEKFQAQTHVDIRLSVVDLQLWYRMNGPTYLAVFIESADVFLIFDIVRYVGHQFGKRIYELDQQSITVKVPTASILDQTAFDLLLRRGDAEEWSRVLTAEPDEIHFCQRDFSVIWRFGTAPERKVEHRMDVTDWQSKLRGEVEILERSLDPDADNLDWVPVREHWQYMLRMQDIEVAYPYLAFTPFDEERQNEIEYWDNEDGEPEYLFSDGTSVYGENFSEEYYYYQLRPTLNATGERLWRMVRTLLKADIVDPPDESQGEFLNVAPWIRGL
jgi:hypothetical protein